MRLNGEYLLHKVAGEWLAFPLEEMAQTFNGVITMNQSGAEIFRMLQQGAQSENIPALLSCRYDISQSQQEIQSFLSELMSFELLGE